jgi:hypothetical protein
MLVGVGIAVLGLVLVALVLVCVLDRSRLGVIAGIAFLVIVACRGVFATVWFFSAVDSFDVALGQR